MLRIAVDGLNLATDRRGMGRYARIVLNTLSARNDALVTIVVRDRRALFAIAGVVNQSAECITLGEARRRRFDATWYPWNGMRFRLTGGSVATIHDVFAFSYPHRNPLARRREQRPINRAINEATTLTTVSEFSAREIAAQFSIPVERLTIACPVPSNFWFPVAPPERAPYFLFIGAADARKNAAMLFRAFAHAFPKHDVQLIIAGTLSIADQRILGSATMAYERVTPSDEELRALYSGAIALLMPSRDEGYGLPAVEAMACGAPVLAADRGGLPEACDGAALLLPFDDAGRWQEAMKAIAASSEQRGALRAESLARAARIDRSRPGEIIAERLRQAAEVVR